MDTTGGLLGATKQAAVSWDMKTVWMHIWALRLCLLAPHAFGGLRNLIQGPGKPPFGNDRSSRSAFGVYRSWTAKS